VCEVDRAIADLNKTIEIDPNYAPGYNNRGEVYRLMGDRKRAIADYRKALQIDPTLPDPKESLANLGAKP
jgi:tetratricopeptide (TPR) repeat protein